jgi:hypothetical protein
MALDSTWGNDHFHRNEIFSAQLKEVLRDELFASRWVNFIGDFTDGSNWKMNSVGELTIDQMAEATSLPDRRPDSGQFVFNINEFVGLKVPFTDVFLEDDFMAPQVLSTLPDRMTRAFEEYLETRMLQLHRQMDATVTANPDDPYAINGVNHRFIAGQGGTDRRLDIEDIAYARYALQKANVPMEGLVGIVDPSFEFNANVDGRTVTVDNPMWQGILETGIGTGLRFVRNIYGFDIYVSNYLDSYDTQTSGLFHRDGTTADNAEVGDKSNLFFSAAGGIDLPFIGAWRRRPVIKSWRDEDKETEYHQMSARFGLQLFRPENLVVCVTDDTLD